MSAAARGQRAARVVVAGTAAALVAVAVVRWIFDVDTVSDAPLPEEPQLSLSAPQVSADADETVVDISGFAPGSTVAALVCGRNAHLAQPDWAIITSRCDTGTMTFGATDAQGSVTLTMSTPRLLRIGSEVVDCALEPCVVRVVSTADPDQDETIELSFEDTSGADMAPVDPPLLAVDPVDVGHATIVKVSGSGLGDLADARIVQCALVGPASWSLCDTPTVWTDVEVNADGTLSAEAEISRYIGTSRGWHDCADLPTGACVLLLSGRPAPGTARRLPTAVPLAFDPDEPPPPITADVLPDSGLVDGTPVTVTFDLAHVRSTQTEPRLAICSAARDACAGLASHMFSSGVAVWITADVPRRFSARDAAGTLTVVDCLDESCVLRLIIPSAQERQADFAIAFDPDAPLQPQADDRAAPQGPPELTVRPGRALRDGETAQLHVRNVPDGELSVELCHAEAASCVELAETLAGQGEAVMEVKTRRLVAHEGRVLDCAPRHCRLRILSDTGIVAEAEIGFDADEPLAPEPAAGSAVAEAEGQKIRP